MRILFSAMRHHLRNGLGRGNLILCIAAVAFSSGFLFRLLIPSVRLFGANSHCAAIRQSCQMKYARTRTAIHDTLLCRGAFFPLTLKLGAL